MNWKTKLFNIQISGIIFFATLMLISCGKENKNNRSRVDVLPFYQDASFTPHWITPGSDSLNVFHRISPFNLTNQEGKKITEKKFSDKIYVTDFFFTSCPGICPKMTANMSILQDTFIDDDEVFLLSHSVTPNQDSVPILKEYAKGKGILSHKWHLVTGDRKQIYDLGRKDYFVEEDLGLKKEEDDFLHTENFVLIDKNKHIRGIYNGLNMASIKQLIADIRLLKKEG